jgi:hypothetical protein
MSNQKINIGNQSNDGTGDSIRTAFQIVNENFQELYGLAGIGDGLFFNKLKDTPRSYLASSATWPALITTDSVGGFYGTLTQKYLVGDGYIVVDNTSSNYIKLSQKSLNLSLDAAPVLGGNIDGSNFRAMNFADPVYPQDLATKNYVDTNTPGSTVNLYVATNGRDTFPIYVDASKQGRSLRTAFASINKACQVAEAIMSTSTQELGPYQKDITLNSGVVTATIFSTSTVGVSFVGDVRLSVNLTGYSGGTDQWQNKDIRPGQFVLGKASNTLGFIEALGQTTTTSGASIINIEYYDVRISSNSVGQAYFPGESLQYSDNVPTTNITIFVESGEYFEQLPIRVVQNVSIRGDEFRRVLIKPAPGRSTSKWRTTYFRRDDNFDGLTRASNNGRSTLAAAGYPYGYHYLVDTQTVTPETALAKMNDEMDVFMLGDASILRAISSHGHGGFMCVLDPLGQILTKSPYIQNCTSFARSVDKQTFSGGVYADGMTGNQISYAANSTTYYTGTLTVSVSGLNRAPQVPFVFYKLGNRYEVDYISNFAPSTGEADFNLNSRANGGMAFSEGYPNQGLITIISGGGAGYQSPPLLIFSQPDNGGGSVAQGTATIVSGVVTRVNITNPGSGYSIGSTASIQFIGGNPVTPASTIIVSSSSIKTGFIGRLGQTIVSETAGNKSILNADFTQMNDVGYGIVVTNNAFSENVSVFTYYNQVGYYANNGGQLRSLNGANGYGNYALKAAGSDPNEVPTPMILNDDLVQTATIVSGILGTFNAANTSGSTSLYIRGYNYVPYNQCKIEVDYATATDANGNILGTQVYTITTVSTVTDSIALSIVPGLVKLDLAGGSNFGISSGGIKAPIPTGTNITIRATNIVRLKGYNPSAFVRPSTVLQFNESTSSIYHILSYDSTGMPTGDIQANLREEFNYVQLVTLDGIWPAPQPGATSIKIRNIVDQTQVDRILASTGTSTTQLTFGWRGTVHRITNYTTATGANITSATITISPALVSTITNAVNTSVGVVLSAGIRAYSLAAITARISTLRVSGHDLYNIGAGSFQQSNVPNDIYGPSTGIISSAKERVEVGKGRVFAITTDQSGNFKVGDYFSVNQDSGSLSIAGSITLTSIDGLKFKKGGAEIHLFSTDDSMVNAASDAVPTEGAIVGYINHRLGLTQGGALVSRIGSGYLDLGGTQNMTGDLKMNNNSINMNGSGTGGKIINLTTGSSQLDATNKSYVDIYENTKIAISGTNYIDPFSSTANSAFGKMTGPLWLVDIPTYNTATWTATTTLIQATTKKYVDQVRQFNTLTDVVLKNEQDTDFVMFGSTSAYITYSTSTNRPMWTWARDVINVRSTTTGIAPTLNSNIVVSRFVNTLTLAIATNTITNSMIWDPGAVSTNGISQSKLNMKRAKTVSTTDGSSLSQADMGLSVYYDQYFSVDANGVVNLANTTSFLVIAQSAQKVQNPISFDFGLLATGSSIYKGNTTTVITVNATNTNISSTIVYRNASGNFSAGTITANLIGNVYASNGSSVILNSGSNGSDATITATLTGRATTATNLWDSANTVGRTLSTGTTQWSVVQRDINGNIWSNLFIGTATQARYADLAEVYVADAKYETGTVLEFGGEYEVTLAQDSTRKVAGVVSAKPAYLMNSECQGEHVVVVALTGRVPVKVRGIIRKGDMMIAAGDGYARPNGSPLLGSVLGKALENFDGGEGVIEIVVGRL